MSLTITLTIGCEDDCSDESRELPAKYEVCGECDGHGTTLCDSMRGAVYTSEDMEELGEDFASEYFKRGGIYDQTCTACKGARVQAVVDRSSLTVADREWLAEYDSEQEEIARDREADAHTYRMESGGWDY